jgi:phytol kinase
LSETIWLELNSRIWFALALVAIFLGAIVALAEGLNRLFSVQGEVTRKIVHIGTGHVILLAWWLDIPAWLGIGASIIASWIALLSYVIPFLPSINSVGRKSLGTFFYAVSMGILIAWFWSLARPEYAALGILIGQNFGKHSYQILGISKSWEGSLTMVVVSFLVASAILFVVIGNLWQTWAIALAVSLVATVLEAFSKLGIDNFTVPIASAALAFALTQALS